MPITPTYPGVYIEEVPPSVRTIVGVSTSITAFIGFFARGPLDEAVRVNDWGAFETEFGGLHRASEVSYQIRQFFLNSGTGAWVIRVGAGATATAAVIVRDTPIAGSTQVFRVHAGRRIRGEREENPGQWGNQLRVEIDYETGDPRDLFPDPTSPIVRTELFNLTVTEVTEQGGRLVPVRSEQFTNLTLRPDVAANAFEKVNEQSKLIQLEDLGNVPNPFVNTFRPAATGTVGAALAEPPAIPANNTTFNVDPGTGAVTCTLNYGTAVPANYEELRPFIEAAIRAQGAALDNPLLLGATVRLERTGIAANPQRFRVLAGRGGRPFNPETLLTFSDNGPDLTATALGLTATPNVQQYSLGTTNTVGAQTVSGLPGNDGAIPNANELRGVRANKTGLYALEDVDLFNILCIPRAADLPPNDMRVVYSEAEAYCRERRAFLIVDIPVGVNNPDAMLTWESQNGNLRDANATVYFPRPRVADPLDDFRLRSIAASGTIAGLYARTDANRGVWKAPAGTEAVLRNVPELAYKLTDAENGTLNPLGLNCLRNFPVISNVSWGARTLMGADVQASPWKYIPVRRLALFIEESLFRGTQWAVFEPNDEPLWAQLRLNVGAFMHNLFRQGAFQGSTPRVAYRVKCDSETTTQNDIDRGIVNILVGFAPLKPAEFVVIRIEQLAGQIQT